MKTKNLSLTEAHASGRKYRRASIPGRAFHRLDAEFDYQWMIKIEGVIKIEDALATDYELESPAKIILVSRNDIRLAMINAGIMNSEQVCNKLFGPEEV
jgi:hypothetical protein